MADSLRDQNCIRQYSVDKCMICGATVSLKVCAKCKHVAYCSKDHQTQDWPVHKKQCKKLSKSGIAKTNDNGEQMGDFTKQLRHLSIDSGGGVSEVTSYTERENVGGTSACSEEQQTQSSDCQSKAVTSIFVNKGESICKRDMYDDGAPEVDNKSKCKNKRQHSTEEFQNFNDSDVFRNKSSESNNSATDTSEQEIGTGSSEQFILETEEASLHAPDYAAEKAKDTGSQSAMSYLSVVESRNKALSEYVMKCLNAYGVCVIDNFLGDCKGTDIFDEVQDMYEGGDLCSGQLVNTSSPKGSVRGDVTTWVDGSEVGCANVNFLISSIDAIMLHCQKSLGHYHIKGRSKAMVAVYPGHATHFLRHVDNPSGDGRCVTCIYYLNKNWNSKVDGGLLRIFPEGANRVANVEPKFDRLLFFWSDRRNPHEVLPAFRTRYAVTVWYYDEQERRKAVKRFKGRADAKTKEIVPLQALSMKNS